MNMTLLIDGVDFSSYLTKKGYTVEYKKIMGANSCYTLDGTYHEDVLARKALVVAPLLPMKSDQLSTILNACDNCNNATFLDAKTNTNVTKNVIATLSSVSVALNKTNALFWNSSGNSITLTIEER